MLDECVKNTWFPRLLRRSEQPNWELVSSHLIDGSEFLILKMPTGEPFCEYAPGRDPKFWHQYYKGFPKRGFVSREACIASAERIAGHSLIVRPAGIAMKAKGVNQ